VLARRQRPSQDRRSRKASWLSAACMVKSTVERSAQRRPLRIAALASRGRSTKAARVLSARRSGRASLTSGPPCQRSTRIEREKRFCVDMRARVEHEMRGDGGAVAQVDVALACGDAADHLAVAAHLLAQARRQARQGAPAIAAGQQQFHRAQHAGRHHHAARAQALVQRTVERAAHAQLVAHGRARPAA
jgi:hypothetical protein